jgi:putative phosphoesterase
MRTAVFSDVHGNLPALERFVSLTRGSVDAYVCLGDVVGYGPWNDECLELVHSLPNVVMLDGNHERMFRNPSLVKHEPPLVQEFFAHSARRFARRDLIEGLPQTHVAAHFACTHTIDSRNIYRDTNIEIGEDLIIGHSHHAFAVMRGNHLLVNCGSIGQNRKRLDVLTYVLLDDGSQEFSLCAAPWAVDVLLRECQDRGYSEMCMAYYRSKVTTP